MTIEAVRLFFSLLLQLYVHFVYRKSIKRVIVVYCLLRDAQIAVLMNHIMIRICLIWLKFCLCSSSSCVHFARLLVFCVHHIEMKHKFYWNIGCFWIWISNYSELSSKIRINDEYQKSYVHCVHHHHMKPVAFHSFVDHRHSMAIMLLFVEFYYYYLCGLSKPRIQIRIESESNGKKSNRWCFVSNWLSSISKPIRFEFEIGNNCFYVSFE